MDNAAILRRWFEEVWNRGREETIDELLAPDAVGHGVGGAGQTHIGPAGFKPFWAQIRGAFPDLRFSIEDVVSEGNKVAGRWTAAMTHRGDTLGVPATHKSLTITGMIFLRIEDGSIREGWNNWDQLSLTRECGLSALSETDR